MTEHEYGTEALDAPHLDTTRNYCQCLCDQCTDGGGNCICPFGCWCGEH